MNENSNQVVQATREDLIIRSKMNIDFAENNLKQLTNLCSSQEQEQDYYLGLIRRQSIFNIDIWNLLKLRNHTNYISPLIICRCIIDDYIRLAYILESSDPLETLTKMNADAYKKNLNNLEKLAKVNDEFFKKQPPYYPTFELVTEIKEIFKSKEKHHKYFDNINEFKLKSFPSTRAIVDSFPIDETGSGINRAFYLWRHLSDYIHFSNFSFELEFDERNEAYNLNYIQEVLYYSYKTIKLAFRFFETRNNLEIIDVDNLEYFYSNAEKE